MNPRAVSDLSVFKTDPFSLLGNPPCDNIYNINNTGPYEIKKIVKLIFSFWRLLSDLNQRSGSCSPTPYRLAKEPDFELLLAETLLEVTL